MSSFDYVRPATLREAGDALNRDGARALAGGTDLIPQLREGRRAASRIVDLKTVAGTSEISISDDGALTFGAAVPVSKISRHRNVISHCEAISDAAGMVGSLQVQNRASLGGNICNGAPSADTVPALIVSDASARIFGLAGERHLAVEELLAAPGRVHLGDGEFLVSVSVTPPEGNSASAYIRFTPRREMDIAIVGAAARVTLDTAGNASDVRIALASVAPTVIRAKSAEASLIGASFSDDAIAAAADAARGDAQPISDTRASAEFRRNLVAVLTRRALERCRQRLV